MPKKLKDILDMCISCLFWGEIVIKFQAGKVVQVERKESIKI